MSDAPPPQPPEDWDAARYPMPRAVFAGALVWTIVTFLAAAAFAVLTFWFGGC